MISGIWFVTKTLLFSVLVLALLQMKFGNKTLEERATLWVQQSNLVAPLESFATSTGRWIKNDSKEFSLNQFWVSLKKSFAHFFAQGEKALNSMDKTEIKSEKRQNQKERAPKRPADTPSEESTDKEGSPKSGTFKWG